jgi:hypothetical protein
MPNDGRREQQPLCCFAAGRSDKKQLWRIFPRVALALLVISGMTEVECSTLSCQPLCVERRSLSYQRHQYPASPRWSLFCLLV